MKGCLSFPRICSIIIWVSPQVSISFKSGENFNNTIKCGCSHAGPEFFFNNTAVNLTFHYYLVVFKAGYHPLLSLKSPCLLGSSKYSISFSMVLMLCLRIHEFLPSAELHKPFSFFFFLLLLKPECNPDCRTTSYIPKGTSRENNSVRKRKISRRKSHKI